MKALSLYVTTCRTIFQSNPDDAGAWANVYRLLSYLREALTCCVCGQLLKCPLSPTFSNCQHHVCRMCLGKKMRLKPSCSWCKDFSKFRENISLRIVLKLYKKLCEYMITTTLHQKWGSLNGGTTVNFCDLIQEGAEFEDDLSQGNSQSGTSRSITNKFRSVKADIELGKNPSVIRKNLNTNTKADVCSKTSFCNFSHLNGEDTASDNTDGVSVLNSSTSIDSRTSEALPENSLYISEELTNLGKRQTTAVMAIDENDIFDTSSKHARLGDGQSGIQPVPLTTVVYKVTSSSGIQQKTYKSKNKQGCRCGLATLNPGKLTCCGQRCPCYVDNKPCVDCRCRGCRNPNKLNLLNVSTQPIDREQQEHVSSTTEDKQMNIKKPLELKQETEENSDVDVCKM
ncbi:male-specific lethal 2 [Tachypleus tridentatus]|uniref:male-specific lethal 2 n=1 Tax=Tachypleus tridentatus TaxID=6853 RepID=UPI003FD21049